MVIRDLCPKGRISEKQVVFLNIIFWRLMERSCDFDRLNFPIKIIGWETYKILISMGQTLQQEWYCFIISLGFFEFAHKLFVGHEFMPIHVGHVHVGHNS